MSRALKIIDAIIIALFIAAGAALIIPQFFGIDTITVRQDMLGNVNVGSTIYAEKDSSDNIKAGDRILDLQTDSVNIYTVESFDNDQDIVTVTGAAQNTYNVSANYLRVITVIPFIGYLMLAVQSPLGLVLLAVLLAYVIAAFVFSELLRRSAPVDEEEDEDADDEDDDDDFYAQLAEKRRKEREKRKADAAKSSPDKEGAADSGMTAISDDTEADRHPAGAVEDEEDAVSEDSLPDVQAALEAALESQPLNHPEGHTENISPDGDAAAAVKTGNEGGAETYLDPVEDDSPVANENGEIELAMPVRSADELLQKAYSDGLDPTVEEDSSTGITLVDYSDCL